MQILTRQDLDPERAQGLTTQKYDKKVPIEGVRVIELRRFCEDGGSFAELARLQKGGIQGIEGFEIAQVNYSDMEPGTIKAWHLHFKQEDLWFVPPIHKLLVGLYDLRKDSPTKGTVQRMVLGEGRAHLLLIPRGVGHGACNLASTRQILMYFVNQTFDPAEPDEHRLDPFLLGRDFWQIQAG